MVFQRMRRAVTANLGLKIISFLFAIFLWIHITAQQEESQTFRIPLQLTNIPDSLTIIHEVPEFMEVTITGTRSNLLKLRLIRRLRASLDLSMAKKGRVNVLLSADMLNLSNEFDPRDVKIENPKALSINFERIIGRSIPVKVAFKGEIPSDIILGQPVILPDRVRVSGAASIVNSIAVLTTEAIDVRNKRGRLTQEVGLDLGRWNIRVRPDKVLVEMDISKRAVRTLANLPPTLLQNSETLSVEYSPRTVSLTIEGPERLINDIVTDDVSIIINITEMPPGKYDLQPEVIVPEGIIKYWLDVDAFEVEIHRPGQGEAPEQGEKPGGEER